MGTKLVAAKLLLKPNTSVWLSHPERLALIEPLPEGVGLVSELAQAAAALVFADSSAALRAILGAHANQLARLSIFWVLYPKANRIDLNRDTLWPILAEPGMRPVPQVAVDEIWSALRFRLLKPGEA